MAHTKTDAIKKLLQQNVQISLIVDVGVNEGTPELIATFPTRKHILLEINPCFKEKIEANYRHIPHEVFFVGLSNVSKDIYRISKSIFSNGVISHTQFSDTPIKVDASQVVSCERCRISRFDELEPSIPLLPNTLLKVDIDGKDVEAIIGFGEHLELITVLIVESTASNLAKTITAMALKEFILFDICDIIYYGPAFYQCDLIFIKKRIRNDILMPNIQDFNKELWRHA